MCIGPRARGAQHYKDVIQVALVEGDMHVPGHDRCFAAVQVQVRQLWRVTVPHWAPVDLSVQVVMKSKVIAIEQEFDGNDQ